MPRLHGGGGEEFGTQLAWVRVGPERLVANEWSMVTIRQEEPSKL
jgi:hypothetical protein